MSTLEMKLQPIGIVRNSINERGWRDWGKIVSEIVIQERWSKALEGIEDFSHIFVLFWMHGIDPEERNRVKTHPRSRLDLPLVGIFATCSPARPNPIGVSVVRLLERNGNLLRVKGLDALDGTPVIDIKPYTPSHRIARPRIPQWLKKLYEELQQSKP